MGIAFNADEIFDIAIQIERNGARFYYQAMDYTSDASVRQLLKSLGALEETHEKAFIDMKQRLSEDASVPATFDPEGQSGAYLQALANSRVFDIRTDPMAKLAGQRTAENILATAIDLEKDSIVFYLGMKEMVPDSMGKDQIDAIIREEMRHITVLSNELAARK